MEKPQLGELVVKPLAAAKKDATADDVRPVLASPEVKESDDFKTCIDEISYGAAVLFIDGESTFFIIGLTKPPGRAVAEPPTQIAVKGPREGFTEDLKVNCALVRKRLKSEKLRMDTVRTGRRSDTAVTVCYIDGVCDPDIPKKLKEQIEGTEPDIVADSSYVGRFVSSRPRSLFKRCGTCEKPDIFCAKLSEGRVGMIVDGSPIAVTVPYMLVEDFQSSEDYYISSYRASILRFLRAVAVLVGVLLPAMYVAGSALQIAAHSLQTAPQYIKFCVRPAAFAEYRDVFNALRAGSFKRGLYPYAKVRGAGDIHSRCAGAGRNGCYGWNSVHSGDNYRRLFRHMPVRRARPRRNHNYPALDISYNIGQHRHVRHSAVCGVFIVLPRNRTGLRRASHGALFAACRARYVRRAFKARYVRPFRAPQGAAQQKQGAA